MAQVKKSEIRSAIISSAELLFRKNGYSHTSMTDIGKAANVAPSNIYVYFGSKLDILYAVYEPWIIDRLLALQSRMDAIADPHERLRQILRTVWQEIPAEDNGFANNLMQAISLEPDQRKGGRAYTSDLLQRCETILATLLGDGASKKSRGSRGLIDPHHVAHIILMAFDGFVLRHHLGAMRHDMDEVIAAMVDLLIRSSPAAKTGTPRI